MWILPKNHPLYSHFAQDMVESKEDLSLLESSLESSLMWRSKPSPLKTWQRRWKRVSWLPHLFGRTLKPCQWNRFKEGLTSSLADTHASHSQPQESDKGKTTPDTSGPTYEEQSTLFALDGASSKTSKDISQWGCLTSLKTWDEWVTERRGEYSQRRKLAPPTDENGCLSWRTPTVAETHNQDYSTQIYLQNQVKMNWPTQMARDWKDGPGQTHRGQRDNSKLPMVVFHDGRQDPANPSTTGKNQGQQLNPNWVEQLMGLPTGWTALDYLETESSQ